MTPWQWWKRVEHWVVIIIILYATVGGLVIVLYHEELGIPVTHVQHDEPGGTGRYQ